VTAYLLGEIEKLAGGGRAGLPGFEHAAHRLRRRAAAVAPALVSIVEAACGAASALGLKKVACSARASPCRAFLRGRLRVPGHRVAVPGADDQAYIHDKYMASWCTACSWTRRGSGCCHRARLVEREGIEAWSWAGRSCR